jgi:hypothetical protein
MTQFIRYVLPGRPGEMHFVMVTEATAAASERSKIERAGGVITSEESFQGGGFTVLHDALRLR